MRGREREWGVRVGRRGRKETDLSTSESLISVAIVFAVASVSLNTLSMTDSSVLVVSIPQKALQSLTTRPPPITSLPRFTVPACIMSASHIVTRGSARQCHKVTAYSRSVELVREKTTHPDPQSSS